MQNFRAIRPEVQWPFHKSPWEVASTSPHGRGLTLAPLGYTAEHAPLGGGRFCPPPCPTRQRMAVGGRGGNGKLSTSTFKHIFKSFLKRSHVRPRPDQMSKLSLFTLSATEAGVITAASPNSAKNKSQGIKKVAYKHGPYTK